MFPLSHYFHMDLYKDYVPVCPYVQEQLASIVMPVRPIMDSSTLRKMLRDHLVSSLTSKGLNYQQQLCEFHYAHKNTAEYNIKIVNFTMMYAICNEINRINLERIYTPNNIILSLFDLKSKFVHQDVLHIYPNEFHTWINNTSIINLDIWILHLQPLTYESMKKVQSDKTHPFWSNCKRTSNHIACKPCSTIYTKEFLTWNITIHFHSDNNPFIDSLIGFLPLPHLRLFTPKMRDIVFSLVVDDFRVNYTNKADAEHRAKIIEARYPITIN